MKMTPHAIAKAVNDAKTLGKRVEVCDADHPGLNLGISPHGVATWNLRMRDPSGKLRRFPVGRHGDLTIAAARKKARSLRVDVEKGADPILEARQKRTAGADLRAGRGTLCALFDLYEQEGDPPKTWFAGAGRKRVERIFAPLLPRAVADLTSADIMRTYDQYDGSRKAAGNGIRALRPILKWAVQRNQAPEGLRNVSPGIGVGRRKRVLSNAELKTLLPILRRWKTNHGPAMLLMLLTLARLNEVEGLTWGEIDLVTATWTLPAHRQKNTRSRDGDRDPIEIPLSTAALSLLKDIRPPSPTPAALVFTGARGGRLSNWDREQKRIFEASGTSGWHRHDLRRTGTTLLGTMKFPPHVLKAALNHVTLTDPLGDTYNREQYRADVREAFKWLGIFLTHLASKPCPQPDLNGKPPTSAHEAMQAETKDVAVFDDVAVVHEWVGE